MIHESLAPLPFHQLRHALALGTHHRHARALTRRRLGRGQLRHPRVGDADDRLAHAPRSRDLNRLVHVVAADRLAERHTNQL